MTQSVANYQKSKEWVLNRVYFDYLDKRFIGKGILRWKVETGFFLEAPIKCSQPLVERVEFRQGLIKKEDRTSIRMWLHDGGIAVAPSVPLNNRNDIVSQERISIPLPRVIFLSQHKQSIGHGEFWRGSALYEGFNITELIDFVEVNTRIKIRDSEIQNYIENRFDGIFYEDESGCRIYGYVEEKRYITFQWKLPKKQFSKAESTRFAESIGIAISIISGQFVHLLEYELFYGHQRRIEIRKTPQPHSLHDLKLMGSGRSNRDLARQLFHNLSTSLARQDNLATICKNIFLQTATAAKQGNWYVQELLVATTLEAALRNIDNEPFSSKKGESKRSWNVGKSLERNLSKLLPGNENLKVKIMTAHGLLRDRNAHPDWLFSQGGSLLDEEMEKSMDSMIFLCHFYGYMILAISGCDSFQLRFPIPISQWGSFLTILPAGSSD